MFDGATEMTNPSNRGSAPGRARDPSKRPGTFKRGHAKVGGRKKGTPNAISADYQKAIYEAAICLGSDGLGTDGFVGYFEFLLMKRPRTACKLLAQLLVLEDCDWPPDEAPTLSLDELNQRARDVIGYGSNVKNPETGMATQWPASELVRIAAKHPEIFGKLLATSLPQPTARLRRACWEARHR